MTEICLMLAFPVTDISGSILQFGSYTPPSALFCPRYYLVISTDLSVAVRLMSPVFPTFFPSTSLWLHPNSLAIPLRSSTPSWQRYLWTCIYLCMIVLHCLLRLIKTLLSSFRDHSPPFPASTWTRSLLLFRLFPSSLGQVPKQTSQNNKTRTICRTLATIQTSCVLIPILT